MNSTSNTHPFYYIIKRCAWRAYSAFADSSKTIAALCMQIGALRMFRIKPIATGDMHLATIGGPAPPGAPGQE